MISAVQGSILRPAIFVQLTFLTGPVYLWSGLGTISWNSQNWTGVGSLGTISMMEEGTSIQARGITLGLSGIDSSMLAGALQELVQELPATIWMGLFDASGDLIPDPTIIWSGQMDEATINVGGDTSSIDLNCESRLLEMDVAVDRLLTQDDSQLVAPGDLAFSFVASIQEINISWGRIPTGTFNV